MNAKISSASLGYATVVFEKWQIRIPDSADPLGNNACSCRCLGVVGERGSTVVIV